VRPLEIVLLVADVVAFALLVLPRRGQAGRAQSAVPAQPAVPARSVYPSLPAVPTLPVVLALPVVAATQALVEGPRWQLIPAYALAVLFGVAGGVRLWRRQPAARGRARRIVVGVGVGAAALGLVVAVALPAVLPVFQLPHPTGPYAIGTVTYHWVDADRDEVITADPNDRRELMVQVWYPASPDPSAPRAPYIDDADAVAAASAALVGLPGFVLGHLRYVRGHAVASAPVADGEAAYPVLVFLPGKGGYRQVNTFQVEELVSHGYVVAAIDQPYTASVVVYPDGRRAEYDRRLEPPQRQPGWDPRTAPAHNPLADGFVPHLAEDVSFVLDQLTEVNRADPQGVLTGRLDLARVGLFGQSLGGNVGGTACLREPRLRACLLEDAYMTAEVVAAGLTQPTMWITRDADTMRLERQKSGGWGDAAIEEHLSTMRAVFESLPGDGYYVEVVGMFHIEMTDVPLFSPLVELTAGGPVGVRRVHEIIYAFSMAFFDRHLRGRPAPLLDGPSPEYPEVRIDSH
jgi:predicted dienelactone hydrolase